MVDAALVADLTGSWMRLLVLSLDEAFGSTAPLGDNADLVA